MTVAEIFLDDCYIHDLTLSRDPVVIDVGGFIGDFSLYAVKRLSARRVIVYEPSPRNWALLLKNIANNGYEDRIEPVNKAVTAVGPNAMMNIDTPDEYQNMVSAYCPSEQPLSAVSEFPWVSCAPGKVTGTVSSLRPRCSGLPLRDHAVESADLLKIDVEGGEYGERTGRCAQSHPEYRVRVRDCAKLESMKQRLLRQGYALRMRRGLVSASRP
jgi:FkbM family methyltransferase